MSESNKNFLKWFILYTALYITVVILMNGCSSTCSELRDAELARFHEQQAAWELHDCNKEPEVCKPSLRQILFDNQIE